MINDGHLRAFYRNLQELSYRTEVDFKLAVAVGPVGRVPKLFLLIFRPQLQKALSKDSMR